MYGTEITGVQMRYILILLAILIWTGAHADSVWFPLDKENAKTYYISQERCEVIEQQDCYNLRDVETGQFKDPRYHDVQTIEVDDPDKPIYKPKYNVDSCASQADCEEMRTSQGGDARCNTGDVALYSKNTLMPGYSLFCTKLLGYEKKEIKDAVEDATKKLAIETADADAKTEKEALDGILNSQYFGRLLVAHLAIRNKAKGLSVGQKKQLAQSISLIQQLLLAGSIDTAKAEIEALVADGTLITVGDKSALLALVDEHLGS